MHASGSGDLSRYEILDRHAVGGVAELYRARDKRTGRVIILKRMRPDLDFDPAVSAGFFREIQLAMDSGHKNLIRGLDRGTHNGLDWVALEFVDGHDLERVLEREKGHGEPLSFELSLFIAREILDGLAFAHQLKDPLGQPMGLVHRDLNPRNILVGYDGGVYVADFGASIATLSEPDPEEVVGSVGYLSPEQARLKPLDPRSDVFAVGCILYELVMKEPAFEREGKSDAQLLKQHQRGQIRRIPSQLPEPIRLVLEIACAPDREDRYVDALTMLRAIDDILASRPLGELKARLGATLRAYFASLLAGV